MILDGKLVAAHVQEKVKEYIAETNAHLDLTIVQVGNSPASNTYVNNKIKACNACGITSKVIKFAAPTPLDAHHNIIDTLKNTNSTAIMLQLPLLEGWPEGKYINTINPNKDADCLTEVSLGAFYTSNDPEFAPCTAQGVIDLLDYYKIDVQGKRVLVIGRSNIVGKPVAHLLTCRNATVTVAHSKTRRSDLVRMFATAHIVVVAAGVPNLLTEEDALQYTKDYRHDYYNSFATIEDRVIIDVGINRTAEGKLCGDLSEDFKSKYSRMYSPVPGGVGPLTVANLLYNTVKLHRKATKVD